MNKILLIILFSFFVLSCQQTELKPMAKSSEPNSKNLSDSSSNTTLTYSSTGINTVTGNSTTTSFFECGTIVKDTADTNLIIADTVAAVKDTLIPKKKYTFLALGDSYTKGEGVISTRSYPVQLVDSLAKIGFEVTKPKIIAQTGWRTDNLMSAIVADGDTNSYDFVFLLIGVNNQYQGTSFSNYAPQFEALLTTALGFANQVKEHVFVLSIPDYGYTPVGQNNQVSVSSQLDQYNAENKRIAVAAGVNYIDITPISRSRVPGLVASDNLHPSALQYKKWVELIIPVIGMRLK